MTQGPRPYPQGTSRLTSGFNLSYDDNEVLYMVIGWGSHSFQRYDPGATTQPLQGGHQGTGLTTGNNSSFV
jgi:hypothetical protein